MGFAIDLIGSLALIGVLILTVAAVNVNLNQALYDSTFELTAQMNLIELARTCEYDFLRIGYADSSRISSPITYAGSDSITFKAAKGGSNNPDLIRYFLGSPTDPGVASTPNPRDRVLYRIENGDPVRGTSLGVVWFHLTYYNSSGDTTSTPSLIKAIRVQLTVESPYPVDSTYAGAYWEKLIYPRNL